MQLNVLFPLAGTVSPNSTLEGRRAFDNFMQDHTTFEHYSMSYDNFMTNMIDYLIMLQDIKCDSPDADDRRVDQVSDDAPSVRQCINLVL